MVQRQVFPCQQVALHQVHAVIDRRANKDGQRNGFHSPHFPARPVHDGHHQADHTCMKKLMLGKFRGLRECCSAFLLQISLRGF